MHENDQVQDSPAIANRYLAGQLSEAECEAYEQHFIENPEALRELEATARLKVGLANLRDAGRLQAEVRAPAPRAQWRVALGIAASVAIVVLTLTLWRETTVRAPMLVTAAAVLTDPAGQRLTPGATYALVKTRSTDYDASVELPSSPQALELRVRLDATATSYRATLSRIHPDGAVRQVAEADALQPGADRFVQLFVDSSQLQPGPYLLVLSPTDGNGAEFSASAFRLKVTRPAGENTPAEQQ